MEGYIMFLRRESCSFLKVGVRKAPALRQMLQTVIKPTFVLRMGSGNEAFPDWNPQAETALSADENGVFQGFFAEKADGIAIHSLSQPIQFM